MDTENRKGLPRSEQSEITILGSCLKFFDIAKSVSLEPSDFYSERNRTIFQAIHAITRSGRAPDPGMVAEEERIERERLEAERKAEADRLEAEREAERAKERAERERLEKAAQRMRELATVGSLLTLDECAAMDDVIFAAALASATAAHAEAQRKADEIRQENARLQREADARAETDRIEAQRKEREAQEEAARIKREADEAEAKRKAEEAKPSLDKAHAWLDAVLAAVAAVPPVEDASVRRDLARWAELLRGVIEEERGNFAPF